MPSYGSISGLISGLQTNEIIEQIMAMKQRPVNLLNAQKTQLNEKLTAWQNVNARLLAVKMRADQLTNLTSFQSKAAVSSDPKVLTASVSSVATEATYTMQVTSLAKTHQLASNASYTTADNDPIGTGTITITNVSSGKQTVINILEGSDSLEGVRDAINASGAGATASIINDGSGTPYRLLLTSKTTGSAGELQITSDLTGGAGISFDGPDAVVTAADNAQVQIGSGSSPIIITSSTNTIANAIPGVTLNLLSANPGQTITLNIQNNTSAIADRVKDFVDTYNDFVGFLKDVAGYDPELQRGGPLLGEFGLQNITSNLSGQIIRNVSGLAGGLSALSSLGIRLASDGRLTLNESQLNEELGKDPNAVGRVFARSGTSTDSRISFLHATSSTRESAGLGYLVNITQAATQTRVTSGAAMSGPLAQSETLTINGQAINLTEGMTMSEVVAAINSRSSATGVRASATGADGTGSGQHLTFTSVSYGSSANITVSSSISAVTAGSSGIGTVAMTGTDPGGETGSGIGAQGLDVAGTINGELATGSGRTLTGAPGNANTAGLAIQVTATETGEIGYVTYSRGVAVGVSELLANLTDISTGLLTTTQDGVRARIDSLDKQMTSMLERLVQEEARIRAQFVALESAMSRMQSQSQFLQANLAGLSNLNNNSR